MKYCIFVLTHNNHLLLEKCLKSIVKYSTPGIPLFIVQNNPSLEVLRVSKRFERDFKIFLFTGNNNPGLAIDNFFEKHNFDFYFKVDDDIIINTNFWDKKLFITYNQFEKTGLISCMIPVNSANWIEFINQSNLKQEFKQKFPNEYLSLKNSELIFSNKELCFWIWKKVLEKGIKPNKKIRKYYNVFSISLIGFRRKLWLEMEKKFSPSDENMINLHCRNNEYDILLDDSVIAHHFSYGHFFNYTLKNVYPLIKDKEF